MWPPFCLTTPCKRTLAFVTTFRHRSSESARHIFWPFLVSSGSQKRPENVAQLRAHIVKLCRALSEDMCRKVMTNARVRLPRGCEAKRWSHWTCSSLGTIFQPMRINSVPDVKCFSNNKMCYVHNQWYDISCATLYSSRQVIQIWIKTLLQFCEHLMTRPRFHT